MRLNATYCNFLHFLLINLLYVFSLGTNYDYYSNCVIINHAIVNLIVIASAAKLPTLRYFILIIANVGLILNEFILKLTFLEQYAKYLIFGEYFIINVSFLYVLLAIFCFLIRRRCCHYGGSVEA